MLVALSALTRSDSLLLPGPFGSRRQTSFSAENVFFGLEHLPVWTCSIRIFEKRIQILHFCWQRLFSVYLMCHLIPYECFCVFFLWPWNHWTHAWLHLQIKPTHDHCFPAHPQHHSTAHQTHLIHHLLLQEQMNPLEPGLATYASTSWPDRSIASTSFSSCQEICDGGDLSWRHF